LAQSASVSSRALSVIRRQPLTLWVASAWPYFLLAIVFLSISTFLHAHPEMTDQRDLVTISNTMPWPTRIAMLAAFFATISVPAGLATGGASFVVWADLTGNEVALKSLFSRIGQFLVRVLFLSLFIGLLNAIGTILLILPGIVVLPLASFVIPSLVIEDSKALSALRRGVKLAGKEFGALVLLYGLGAIVLLLAGFGFVTVISSAGDHSWWVSPLTFWVSYVVFASLVMMAKTVVVVLLYRDAREKQELLVTSEA
jgi:hypothetical protein